MSATFIICSSLGDKVFPVMVGNLVEDWPMMLHYLCLAIFCVCVLIFSLASLIISRSEHNLLLSREGENAAGGNDNEDTN